MLRHVPMLNVTLGDIGSRLKVLGAWSLNRKNDLVFYNHGIGEKFVDLKAGFALACKKAGISDVSWHTLRHTFASRLLDRGVDIVTAQAVHGISEMYKVGVAENSGCLRRLRRRAKLKG
jgi:integrase